ncbi:unnamed protein product [Meloidogyne enterolobii]|uniref:Uncharacterized protein n=1 Tax=Meloidogyne enterolobii TaxID=390850 RepID=A0ACB1AF48_MELEN
MGKARILLPMKMKKEYEKLTEEQKCGILVVFANNIRDVYGSIFPEEKGDNSLDDKKEDTILTRRHQK